MLHLVSDVNLRLQNKIKLDLVSSSGLHVVVHQLSNSSHAAQDLSTSVHNALEDASVLALVLTANSL